MDEKESTYIIPHNFTGMGKLMNHGIRNWIEAAIVALLAANVIMKVPFTMYAKIVVFTLVVGGLFIFFLIGIKDESVTQFLWGCIMFRRKRRIYHMKRPDQVEPDKPKAEEGGYESYYVRTKKALRRKKES